MGRTSVNLTTCFADISGSTRLYESLGDATARELVAECIELMSGCIASHRGKIVKTIGDEVMCIFAKAESSVRAAIAMQEAVLEELPKRKPETPGWMTLRIGLHAGPVIAEGGDVFGDAVNLAARMADVAKGGQIITTRDTVNRVPLDLRTVARHLDRVAVKGKAEEVDIFEIVWQPDEVTRIAPTMRSRIDHGQLRVIYRGVEKTVDPRMAGFVLGRGKQADIVVDDTMASREHARIECRRGNYFVADLSTNGTYVETSQGISFLKREEIQITGTGRIGLGRPPGEADNVVHFSLSG